MKRGFTLAEVLITLGVIGVVSAMTLPVLVKKYQQHVAVTQLKKAYTILNQAFKMSEIDNDAFENWNTIGDIGISEYTKKYWKPYFKVIKECSDFVGCGYKTAFPWVNVNKTRIAAPCNFRVKYFIIINNGTILQFSSYANGSITVDLNGTASPNQYGKDVFIFTITQKGVNLKGNGTTTLYCSRDYTGGDNGEYCGGKIVVDGWKIADDYPW